MNHEQLSVGLSTLIVIGIALYMYGLSKGGKARLPLWVWPALIPYLAFAFLSRLLHGLAAMIGWLKKRRI